MSVSRTRRAAVLALALSLTAAPAVLAADVTDSFTVANAITVTGIPASIDYGTIAPGSTSAAVAIDAMVSANAAWRLDVSGTDFDRTGGGTLAKSAREGQMSTNPAGAGAGVVIDPLPESWQTFDSAEFTDADAEATGPVSGTPLLVRTELRVNLPMDTLAGVYAGTVTITVSAQ